MATYVEINGNKYPASITGRLNDKDWNNRESKAIQLEMEYADALALFIDDAQWNIVQDIEVYIEKLDESGNAVIDEHGEPVFDIVQKYEVYDNSDYCIAGDIINHRDGTITAKMGKPTAEELLIMLEEVL